MSIVQEDSVTPSHAEFNPSTTFEDEFDMFAAIEDYLDMSSDDEFDLPIDESYMVHHGNITRFYWQSVHEKLDEIVCESQVPTLSIEIQLKEYCRRIDVEGHRSEEEFRTVVETLSNDLYNFLEAETSKRHVAEMVSHLNIHTNCVESVALNISDIVKKAHEVGRKMVHIVADFEVLILVEEEEEEEEEEDDDEEEDEDEDETLIEALRESMDLAYERRASIVPALRSSVEVLERMRFNKGELDEIKCTICLNELCTGMEVIHMPCSHIFDVECIIQWLEINHVCPLCRFKMPQQLEEI